MLFHDPSFISSRPLFNIRSGPSSQTPLPPRASEPKIISGKVGNRRYSIHHIMANLSQCIGTL